MIQAEYYQLYGYGANGPWLSRHATPEGWHGSRSSSAQELAKRLFDAKYLRSPYDPDAVELIQGILPSGASYLFLERAQMQAFVNEYRLQPGLPPSRFESLSPVLFDSPTELALKLAKYEQKRRKNSSKMNRDNCALNSDFTWEGEPQGSSRARFELQRLLYHVWCHPATFPFSMLSLDPSIWSQRTLRIVSLVFLVWDQTLSANDNPKALEFGMVQMTVSARGYPRPGKTTYLALKTSLRNTDAAASFREKGEKEELLQAQFDQRIHDVVTAATASSSSNISTVLLVYNARATRQILSGCGINTNAWEDGVASLLAPRYVMDGSQAIKHGSRSRSRSPWCNGVTPKPDLRRRDYSEPWEHKADPIVARKAPTNASSIHMVDVADLYNRLFRSNTIDPGYAFHLELRRQANRLGVSAEEGSCAGNDCHTLFGMWLTMARGNAIDDQYEARTTVALESLAKQELLATPAPQRPQGDSDDDDYDPNDIPPLHTTTTSARDPMALGSDDEDEEDGY